MVIRIPIVHGTIAKFERQSFLYYFYFYEHFGISMRNPAEAQNWKHTLQIKETALQICPGRRDKCENDWWNYSTPLFQLEKQ